VPLGLSEHEQLAEECERTNAKSGGFFLVSGASAKFSSTLVGGGGGLRSLACVGCHWPSLSCVGCRGPSWAAAAVV
jgi:hypothetical protein